MIEVEVDAMANAAALKMVLLPFLCFDAPAGEIPQPAILNVRHEVLPDRDTTRVVGAIREGCTLTDDNLCTTADGLIHSERVFTSPFCGTVCAPPKSHASVHLGTLAHIGLTLTRTHFRWLIGGIELPLGPNGHPP